MLLFLCYSDKAGETLDGDKAGEKQNGDKAGDKHEDEQQETNNR